MKAPKTTKVSKDQVEDENFMPPCKWYYVDAFFDYVFIHKTKRQEAQAWVDFYHGKGKYNIRRGDLSKREKLP